MITSSIEKKLKIHIIVIKRLSLQIQNHTRQQTTNITVRPDHVSDTRREDILLRVLHAF